MKPERRTQDDQPLGERLVRALCDLAGRSQPSLRTMIARRCGSPWCQLCRGLRPSGDLPSHLSDRDLTFGRAHSRSAQTNDAVVLPDHRLLLALARERWFCHFLRRPGLTSSPAFAFSVLITAPVLRSDACLSKKDNAIFGPRQKSGEVRIDPSEGLGDPEKGRRYAVMKDARQRDRDLGPLGHGRRFG